MAEAKTTTAKNVKVNKPAEEAEERVPYFIPYIEGEGTDRVVILDGKSYIIQKGVQVMIPKGVAEVLDHSSTQNVLAAKRRESLKNVSI